MKTFVNLLPASFQRQIVIRRRIVQWSAVLVAGLTIGGLMRWRDVRIHDETSKRLDLLSREHQPTQTMLQQLVDMRRELDEMQQQENVAAELEYHRPALALLAILSDIGERTEGKLRITKLELTGLQTPPAGSQDGQGAPNVLLTGHSLDNQSIAQLVSGLNDSGFFSMVELVNSTEMEMEGGLLREYQVRCEL
jgi:hypothetical protein